MTPAVRTVLLGNYCTEARTLFAAMTAQPTASRKRLINSLIVGLKAAGIWSLLDVLVVLTALDAQSALLDWKVPTRTATAVNSPTFAVDSGYAFDGATNYLSFPYTPNTDKVNLSQNSEFIAVYERTNVNSTGTAVGSRSVGTKYLAVNPRNGSGHIAGGCSSDLQAGTASITDSRGLTVINRADATNLTFDMNGALIETVAPVNMTVGLSTVSTFVGCHNSAGTPATFRATTIGMFAIGGSLSATQRATLYTVTQAFMAAIGANV